MLALKEVKREDKEQEKEQELEATLVVEESVCEVEAERSDPVTMKRVVDLACKLMKVSNLRTLTPTLRTLVESVILPCVARPEPSIRNSALQSLGIATIWDKRLALQYHHLFVQVCEMDVEAIQVSALKCIFDCFLVHSLEPFVEQVAAEAAKQSDSDSDSDELEDFEDAAGELAFNFMSLPDLPLTYLQILKRLCSLD